ncbi:MAG TPA: DMT family transporter [Anaerolineales bacterium]
MIPSPSKKIFLPYLALGTGILALSFSAMFVRWAEAPASIMGFYRMLFATLFLLPFFLHSRKGAKPIGRAILWAPLLGGLMTAMDHFIWNTSLGLTNVATATILNNTAPLWVGLVAWFIFKERLKGQFWTGLALALAGAVAVMGNDMLRHSTLGWGDIVALVSGLFYAGYMLVTQLGRERLNTLSYVWMTAACSSLYLLIISQLQGLPLTGYSPRTYLIFLAAALFSQVGGYLCLVYALGHLPASVVSPTMIIQPVLTALLAIPLLGEALHPIQALGGLAVLLGIFLVHRSREEAGHGQSRMAAVDGIELSQ